MAEDTSKMPVETDKAAPSTLRPRRPFESLRQEIDRLFDDFGIGMWRSPFRSSFFGMEPFRGAKAAFGGMPVVDVAETEKAYEVIAELPGMDERNIEVKIANGILRSREKNRTTRRRRRRTTMFANAVLVHSSAHSRCPTELTSIRSTPASKKAC